MTESRSASLSRRAFSCGLLATIATTANAHSPQQDAAREISNLAPGEFSWHPELQPYGAVSVIVSIPEQLVHVYRNGLRIAVSTCSSGKSGHRTPRGVFVVLQKDKHHRSSTYNNAPMPNMNRLTWSGIALHAGDLPGYPASHGCVRLPLEFSERLFEITELGTPVIIANEPNDPWELTHPGLVLTAFSGGLLSSAVEGDRDHRAKQWHDSMEHPVVSILVSSADREILLVRNGTIEARAPIGLTGETRLGSNVIILNGLTQKAGGVWTALRRDNSIWDEDKPDHQILSRLSTTPEFAEAMLTAAHPGLILVTTDFPLSPDTRSGEDFVIMTFDPEDIPSPMPRPAWRA